MGSVVLELKLWSGNLNDTGLVLTLGISESLCYKLSFQTEDIQLCGDLLFTELFKTSEGHRPLIMFWFMLVRFEP